MTQDDANSVAFKNVGDIANAVGSNDRKPTGQILAELRRAGSDFRFGWFHKTQTDVSLRQLVGDCFRRDFCNAQARRWKSSIAGG